MNVKIITCPKLQSSPIVWDCFRGTYTQLMCTVANLIECGINIEIESVTPEITLCFQMYNTNGHQQSTRKVIGGSLFSCEYIVKDVKEETLAKYFTEFFDDYIANQNSKLSDDGSW